MSAVEGNIRDIEIGSGERTRKLELSKILPFTMGDRKRLLAEFGLNMRRAVEFTPEEDANLVWYILRKLDASVTLEEVEALPTVYGQSIVAFAAAVSQAVDRPFSQPSIG